MGCSFLKFGTSKEVLWDLGQRVVWEAEQGAWLARSGGFEKGSCEPVAAVFDCSGEGSQEDLHAKQGNGKRFVEPFNQHCEKHNIFICRNSIMGFIFCLI